MIDGGFREFASRRNTWIGISLFLMAVICLSWCIEARGYFYRIWYGDRIQIGKVIFELPKGFYICDRANGVYVVCNVADNNVQFHMDSWSGKPSMDIIHKRVESAGGYAKEYKANGILVDELIFRSSEWREDLGITQYILPELGVRVTYFGTTSMMYKSMHELVANIESSDD